VCTAHASTSSGRGHGVRCHSFLSMHCTTPPHVQHARVGNAAWSLRLTPLATHCGAPSRPHPCCAHRAFIHDTIKPSPQTQQPAPPPRARSVSTACAPARLLSARLALCQPPLSCSAPLRAAPSTSLSPSLPPPPRVGLLLRHGLRLLLRHNPPLLCQVIVCGTTPLPVLFHVL
jgi:hypothetical protein